MEPGSRQVDPRTVLTTATEVLVPFLTPLKLYRFSKAVAHLDSVKRKVSKAELAVMSAGETFRLGLLAFGLIQTDIAPLVVAAAGYAVLGIANRKWANRIEADVSGSQDFTKS